MKLQISDKAPQLPVGIIGVVGRAVAMPGRAEVYEGFDREFPVLLGDLGFVPIGLSATCIDPMAILDQIDFAGFLLSGGGDVGQPPGRADLENLILHHAFDKGVPVLGICRGMQVIVNWFGGRLVPGSGHVHTRHDVVVEGRETREVNSFHRIVVPAKGLPDVLAPLAEAPDGTIEAIKHVDLPWFGMMWHPERENPFNPSDHALIKQCFTRRDS